jgi:predicted dehydrogenase
MNHNNVYHSGYLSRRNVLKTILFTPPLMLFSKGGLFAAQEIEPVFEPRMIPAGQKVRAAQIGVFNRGNEVLGSFKSFSDKQIKYVAFADVAFPSQGASVNGFEGVPCFQDYRQMLEEMHEQIDAVIIATPDHAHFPMVMHSMLLGKHVYVEKPMAQNVYECRLLEKAARACKVVTQMGNQGHSGAGTIQFGQWVEAGLVKNVKKVDAWMTNSRRWHGWTDTEYPESIPPIGFDWDLWLCRRPFRPHSEKLTGGNWRCWYEFGCGAMGDWGAHILDAVHHYLKLGQPYEISTTLKGPSDLLYPQGSVITFKFKGRDGMPPLEVNWYDGQKNNPTPPAGVTGDIGNVGSFIYTDDYVIRGTSHGGDYKILPNEKMLDLQKAGKLPKPEGNLPNHYQNFLNACQGLEKANSRFEISAPLAEMLCLGCIGQRFGGTLQYDAEAMKITNHAEADAMLKGPQVRSGWEAYDQRKPAKSKAAQIKKPEEVEWDNLIDSTLSQWENPYEWGKAEVVNKEVHLTTDKDKWFLLTKKEYANFIFEGEIKMPVKEGNSGFMFRCQKGKNRAWGYQAEVDTADRKWSGGLYDEGRRMWFASPNKDKAADEAQKNASIEAFRARAGDCYKQGEWNLYRIVCIGPHIQIYVNGTLTTDIYDEMDTAGYLGIQHHGEKGLVYQFRNLRVKDLGAGGEIYYPHRETAKAAAVASKMAGAIYEAEAANKLSADAKPADNHGGFQGTGFVDMGGAGSFVEWNNVLADKGGQYKLTFRYAAAGDRPCELFVNGASAGKLAFANTGNWTDWKTVDATVTFKNGGNIVRVSALGDGPNIDAMAVNAAN